MNTLLFLAAGMIALCAPLLSMNAFAQSASTQAPGYYRVQLGSYTVTALSDGTLAISHAKLLHGGAQTEIDQTYRNAGVDDNRREASINAFLIDTGSKRILVDAGAGSLFGARCGHLPEMLAAAGYDVNSIDAILLTHVHGDHSGGITSDGKRVFPNATLYLAKAELDYWMSDDAKAKAKASHQTMFVTGRAALAPYLAAGRVQTFTGGAEIFPGIRTIAAPGHTPGHTQYEFTSAGHTMIFIGDMIHVAEIQLPMPAVTIDYDANEAEAAKTRIETLAALARTHELVAAPHISFPGLGHIYKQGDGYAWAPVPYAAYVVQVGQ
jgi:glyoxylase-like metal-dependent hydrolase (beta-lactamase superfamily II)